MSGIKLGIVGVGKIARDQHLPVIAESQDFELVAAASRNARVDAVKNFATLEDMLAGAPELEAISICTPPVAHAADARRALLAGKHVMVEKPPGATVSEVQSLAALAAERGLGFNASWHSRHAAAVERAQTWLATRTVSRASITWKEDVRVWHPGQEWILAAGGLGVFDPAINALSIVTAILPEPFALVRGQLAFPDNRQAPIRATLQFRTVSGAPLDADFDFLQTGPQTWDIEIVADGETLLLSKGGEEMRLNGERQALPAAREYVGVYARFADVVRARRVDCDLSPLTHVADCFMLSERVAAPAFSF